MASAPGSPSDAGAPAAPKKSVLDRKVSDSVVIGAALAAELSCDISAQSTEPASEDTHWAKGVAHLQAGELDAAVSAFSLATEDAVEANDLVKAIRCYSTVGILHRRQRAYSQATTCHMRQLEMAQESKEPSLICEAHHMLGQAYFRQAQHACKMGSETEESASLAEATAHFDQMLQLAKALNDRLAITKAYKGLGLVSLARMETKIAVECLEKHLSGARKVGSEEMQAAACFSLYRALRAHLGWDDSSFFSSILKQEFERLVELLWERAALAEQLCNRRMSAETYLELGRLYEDSGSLSSYHGVRKARELCVATPASPAEGLLRVSSPACPRNPPIPCAALRPA